MGLFECHQCGGDVGEGARACPHCGGYPYSLKRRQVVGLIALGIVFAAVLAYQLLWAGASAAP